MVETLPDPPVPVRRPISLSLRFSVFERDGYICQYCGRKPPHVVLHVDHVKPIARGGDNRIDNLLTACRECNLGKGARDPGLPMASRPRTPDEEKGWAAYLARNWANCADVREEIRSLLWEIAANADPDGAIIRIWHREDDVEARLNGLAAVGFIRVVARGRGAWAVTIQHWRGRADVSGHPWALYGHPIAFAPTVAEIY